MIPFPFGFLLQCPRSAHSASNQIHFRKQGEVTRSKVNQNFIARYDPRDERWIVVSHLMKHTAYVKTQLLLIEYQEPRDKHRSTETQVQLLREDLLADSLSDSNYGKELIDGPHE